MLTLGLFEGVLAATIGAFIGSVVLMRYASKQMHALERAPLRTVEARSESMQPVEYRRAG